MFVCNVQLLFQILPEIYLHFPGWSVRASPRFGPQIRALSLVVPEISMLYYDK